MKNAPYYLGPGCPNLFPMDDHLLATFSRLAPDHAECEVSELPRSSQDYKLFCATHFVVLTFTAKNLIEGLKEPL